MQWNTTPLLSTLPKKITMGDISKNQSAWPDAKLWSTKESTAAYSQIWIPFFRIRKPPDERIQLWDW